MYGSDSYQVLLGIWLDRLTQAGIEAFLINKLQTPFDKSKDKLKRVSEGAHSDARVIYHADKTGESIHKSSLAYLESLPGVEVISNHTAIDLLTFSHHSTVSTDILAIRPRRGSDVILPILYC